MKTTSLFAAFMFSFPLTIASPAKQKYTLPKKTLPNGEANPFFPCPAAKNAALTCPYRCYVEPSRDRPSPGSADLLHKCFSHSEAASLINGLEHICVKCVAPDPVEIPKSKSTAKECQPLSTYFGSLNRKGKVPARCGTRADPIKPCAWDCAMAQVPFDSCSATNDTGTFELCSKCTPGCSSPVLVTGGADVKEKKGFNIFEGDCGGNNQFAENVACPFRCKDTGNPNTYCSLVDKTVQMGFTNCTRCGD